MKLKRILLFLVLPTATFAADVTGFWNLTLIRFGEETNSARVEFKVEGSKLTGTLNELKLEGTFLDGVLKFKGVRPDGKLFGELEGRLTGDLLEGSVKQGEDQFLWKARRISVSQGPPRTHTFEPVKFPSVFSGAIEPVLSIQPGDTVRTTTVDAGGRDAKGIRRSLGGNPQTGPFYIEGANPGDTLSVKFSKIRLNRDSAWSGNRIVAGALTPNYYKNAKLEDKFNREWKLDREAGVGMLAKATERLKNFRIQLNPMLGSVAVVR